jgi:hypothetical protein
MTAVFTHQQLITSSVTGFNTTRPPLPVEKRDAIYGTFLRLSCLLLRLIFIIFPGFVRWKYRSISLSIISKKMGTFLRDKRSRTVQPQQDNA